MSVPGIIARLDVALQKMSFRQMEVRAIYLTEADQKLFNRAMSKRHGMKLSCLAYQDHQIRRGEKSIIYSTHGVGVAVPKRISSRVKVAA